MHFKQESLSFIKYVRFSCWILLFMVKTGSIKIRSKKQNIEVHFEFTPDEQ